MRYITLYFAVVSTVLSSDVLGMGGIYCVGVIPLPFLMHTL